MPLTEKPKFRKTIDACKVIGLLNDEDERDLLRLMEIRNALTHFRAVANESNLDQRSTNQRKNGFTVLADDARFAIFVLVRILAKPDFRFKPDT